MDEPLATCTKCGNEFRKFGPDWLKRCLDCRETFRVQAAARREDLVEKLRRHVGRRITEGYMILGWWIDDQ